MRPPLAYFLTWTTYGSWVRGDERGWVGEDAAGGVGVRAPDAVLARRDRGWVGRGVVLDEAMRSSVDETMREVSEHRGWTLSELAVRSNHVHAVVSASVVPERVMADFKAWSTRRLRECGLVGADAKVWTRHGSTRWLNDERSLVAAIAYVRDQDRHRRTPTRELG